MRYESKPSEAARQIIAMHKRHGEVVSGVLEQKVREYAAQVVSGTVDSTSLLTMAIGRRDVKLSGEETVSGGKQPPAFSQDAVIARVEQSLKDLHAKFDARIAPRKARDKSARKLTKRDAVIFAAILRGHEGTMYCSYLNKHGVRPKWEGPYSNDCLHAYKAAGRWRKRVQDEKTRAKQRMTAYLDAALADAFNTYLSEEFDGLKPLLNSRNACVASKAFTTPNLHKH